MHVVFPSKQPLICHHSLTLVYYITFFLYCFSTMSHYVVHFAYTLNWCTTYANQVCDVSIRFYVPHAILFNALQMIVKAAHLAELRQFVARLHNMTFDEAFRDIIQDDAYSQVEIQHVHKWLSTSI